MQNSRCISRNRIFSVLDVFTLKKLIFNVKKKSYKLKSLNSLNNKNQHSMFKDLHKNTQLAKFIAALSSYTNLVFVGLADTVLIK